MLSLLRMRWMPIVATCVALQFCLSLNVQASTLKNSVRPEILKIILSMVGLETEIKDLNRGDGFEKGIYIEGIQDVRIMIGFSKAGIEKGIPFLLSVEGVEVLVELSEEGVLSVNEGDGEFIPSGISDFVECIMNAVAELVEDILDCRDPFCIIIYSLYGIFRILWCIFNLL